MNDDDFAGVDEQAAAKKQPVVSQILCMLSGEWIADLFSFGCETTMLRTTTTELGRELPRRP